MSIRSLHASGLEGSPCAVQQARNCTKLLQAMDLCVGGAFISAIGFALILFYFCPCVRCELCLGNVATLRRWSCMHECCSRFCLSQMHLRMSSHLYSFVMACLLPCIVSFYHSVWHVGFFQGVTCHEVHCDCRRRGFSKLEQAAKYASDTDDRTPDATATIRVVPRGVPDAVADDSEGIGESRRSQVHSPPMTAPMLPPLSDIGEEVSGKSSTFSVPASARIQEQQRQQMQAQAHLPPRGPTYASRAQLEDFARRERAAAAGSATTAGDHAVRSNRSTDSADCALQQCTSLDCYTCPPTTGASRTPPSCSLDGSCASNTYVQPRMSAPAAAPSQSFIERPTTPATPNNPFRQPLGPRDCGEAPGSSPAFAGLRRSASAASVASGDGGQMQRYSSTGILLPMPPKQSASDSTAATAAL